MEERRRHPRLRSLIGGRITFNHDCSTLDCVLRNISAGGAMLACTSHVVLPRVFELFLPTRNQRMRVRVVWCDADRIGVALPSTR